MKLTAKQEAFVSEYLIDLNATQAAIRSGYSEHTAQRIGSENLSKPLVAEAIAKAREKAMKRNETTVDTIDGMLKKAFVVGEDKENSAGMTAAANGLAKLHGLIIDKAKVEQSNESIDRLVDAVLDARES